MNSKAALLLMLFAIVIASFQHGKKLSAKDNDMDRLAKGLSGIQTHIKAGSRILVENKTAKVELGFQARYHMAPNITNMTGSADTILLIADKNNAVSIDSSRKLLWSNSDSSYSYSLTCTH